MSKQLLEEVDKLLKSYGFDTHYTKRFEIKGDHDFDEHNIDIDHLTLNQMLDMNSIPSSPIGVWLFYDSENWKCPIKIESSNFDCKDYDEKNKCQALTCSDSGQIYIDLKEKSLEQIDFSAQEECDHLRGLSARIEKIAQQNGFTYKK